MRSLLKKVGTGLLTEAEAFVAMQVIMSGEENPQLIEEFLLAMNKRVVAADELYGFVRAIRETSLPIQTRLGPLTDICGTGGDKLNTFNISTAAAFIASGAGVRIAKHGNRSASSISGSADVLESLGVNINLSPEQVAKCIDEVGIGFLYARTFHPGLDALAVIRRKLRVPTIFNLLGPLTNPVRPEQMVVGVADQRWMDPCVQTLLKLGVERALVVHGVGGFDEASTLGETKMISVFCGETGEESIFPDEFEFAEGTLSKLQCHSTSESARMVRRCLNPTEETNDGKDIALLNASLAILIDGQAEDLATALIQAKLSCLSGAALGKLEHLIAFSQKHARH
jgi:anthranilate phosphoribosyltransferase